MSQAIEISPPTGPRSEHELNTAMVEARIKRKTEGSPYMQSNLRPLHNPMDQYLPIAILAGSVNGENAQSIAE